MSQSVWHKQEIENILRGIELTCQLMAAADDTGKLASYKQGFLAALAATGTSFGIKINETGVRIVAGSTVHRSVQLREPET